MYLVSFGVSFDIHSYCSAREWYEHYNDVIMSVIASQITSFTVVYTIVYSDTDQRKHQSSASLTFVWGIHRGPVNSPHKWPVTRKMFPIDDVIMWHRLMMLLHVILSKVCLRYGIPTMTARDIGASERQCQATVEVWNTASNKGLYIRHFQVTQY